MPCVRPLYTQYMCTCLFYVHSSYEWITLFVRARVFLCVCVWLCRSLWNDCTVVNKQKQALALMKGCCHLFCRSVTIRAPSGSSDRLFFCITLNKRVQCINLTLLGGNKGRSTDTVLQQRKNGNIRCLISGHTWFCYDHGSIQGRCSMF